MLLHRVGHLLLLLLLLLRRTAAQSSRHGRLGRRHQLRLGLIHRRPLPGAHGTVHLLLLLLLRICSCRCRRLLHLVPGHLGGHRPVVQVDAVDDDRHEGGGLLVSMMPVGRVVVMPLLVVVVGSMVVLVMISVSVSIIVGIAISIVLVVMPLFVVVAVAVAALATNNVAAVPASLPWSAIASGLASGTAVAIFGAGVFIVIVIVIVVAPLPVPFGSCVGARHGLSLSVSPGRSLVMLSQTQNEMCQLSGRFWNRARSDMLVCESD